MVPLTALRWAYANGVINGVSDTRFAPNQPMTREQLVTVLYRFLCSLASAAGRRRPSTLMRTERTWPTMRSRLQLGQWPPVWSTA